MRIAFFGSSLVSAYWNGAATYYRGLLRALHGRGFRTTFFEPDAFERLAHRDIPDPPWASVRVYEATQSEVDRALEEARECDLIVKASGVGVFDEYLEAAVLSLKRSNNVVAFWDVDAPATLTRLANDPGDPFADLVGRYDVIFTYGGGGPVIDAYQNYGARACIPIYNALDPTTHHPVPAQPKYQAGLSFLGNRLPDREDRVREFFLLPALRLGSESFILGGNGWETEQLPSNVRNLGHVYTQDHNAFYSSPRAVLNVSRQSMATFGFSPATRVFEAAGAGACLISDAWEGIELFLEPGRELLVASSGEEVVEILSSLDEGRARAIGKQALERVLAHHTYEKRALEVESVLAGRSISSTPSIAAEPRRQPAGAAARTPATASEQDEALRIVVLGLTITSTWGNGHATTYRALVRELGRQGHDVLFLERNKPWYARARDLVAPPYCRTELYSSLDELRQRHAAAVSEADLVVVGSFVPEGTAVGEWVTAAARGVTAFYDIDTPVTLAGLKAGSCDYQSPELVPKYDLYLSFTGGPTLETLERRWGARRALPLYCSVDPEIYYPEALGCEWDLGYMGTYSEDRQMALERLLLTPARSIPHCRFAVAGSSYPEDVNWPAAVEHLGHLPSAEHRRFYNQQRFTLNITRREMIAAGFSPSVRLFEAAACGAAILTDRWSGLAHFFTTGEELLVVDDSRDVIRALTEMPDAERLALGSRARARVLREHTAAHRARALVRYAKRARREMRDVAKVRTA